MSLSTLIGKDIIYKNVVCNFVGTADNDNLDEVVYPFWICLHELLNRFPNRMTYLLETVKSGLLPLANINTHAHTNINISLSLSPSLS